MTPEELARCKASGGAAPKVVTVHGVRPGDFAVLEPAKMQYRAQAQPTDWTIHECAGCMFRHQGSAVCKEAARLAAKAGMQDCDHGFVYVAVAADHRQLTLDENQ